MEVVNNALKNNVKETYLKKKCTCGSDLIIINEDILNIIPDEKGKIFILCPCCGSKIELYKYFGGKMYTFNQYSECAAAFKEDVFYIIKELSDINMGYGTEFFRLSKLNIVPRPAKIFFDTYIDEYEYGNWEKKIEKYKKYRNYLTVDISEKIVCTSIYEYAQYTQALTDYILKMLAHEGWSNENPYSELILNVDTQHLIRFFRDPNVDVSDFYFNPSGFNKIANMAKKEERTIFTPDIKDGLECVGEKVEDGCNNISNGLYEISRRIHNASLTEAHSIKMYKQV